MNENQANEVKQNIINLKNRIAILLFHRDTLEKQIGLVKPKFESRIKQFSTFGSKDVKSFEQLQEELIPVEKATPEQLEARAQYFHLNDEMSRVTTEIDSLKLTYKQYLQHMQQYFKKTTDDISIAKIEDQIKVAEKLENLDDAEKKTLDNLIQNWNVAKHRGKYARYEFYESLNNFILQHGE